MASLIITIISLAIFAIVAAMGIYYGGQAFQNAQNQAYANQIISGMQQLSAAMNIVIQTKGCATVADSTCSLAGNNFLNIISFGALSEIPMMPNAVPVTGAGSGNGCPSASSASFNNCRYGGINFGNGELYQGRRQFCYNTTTNTNQVFLSLYPVTDFNSQHGNSGSIGSTLLAICKNINAQFPPPTGTSTDATTGLPITNSGAGDCYIRPCRHLTQP